MPLTYTPRKFVGYPYNNIFYQIETDHRAYAPAAVERIVLEKVCGCPLSDLVPFATSEQAVCQAKLTK
jgi:hypothetical protein